MTRYEIEGNDDDWAEAEKITLKAAQDGRENLTVSVKSQKAKRKAGATAAEIYEKYLEKAQKKHKKPRRDKGKGQ